MSAVHSTNGGGGMLQGWGNTVRILDFDMAFIRFYNQQYQGSKTPWCCRAKVLSGYSKPKGGLMKPMKKPVRLLGMVFQIDK